MDVTALSLLSLIGAGALGAGGVKLNEYIARRRLGDRLPGPKANLLLGNLTDLEQAGGFQNYLPAIHQQYGSIVRFWLGPNELTISISDAEILGQVANNSSGRPEAIRKLLGWLGKESITFQKPPKLITSRAKFLTLLTGQCLENLCSAVHVHTSRMLDRWSEGTNTFDIKEEFSNLNLNIIGDCSFGQEFCNTPIGEEIRTLFENILATTQQRVQEIVPPIWHPSYRQWKQDVSRLHEYAGELIEQRKKSQKLNQKHDLLSLVLNEKNDNDSALFSDAEARSAVISFLFSGFDDTRSGLTWTCYLLATHPEIQALARKEIQQVLAGRLPELEDLPKLEYLSRVIKEGLRLYTPNPMTMRVIDSDIQVGDYTIPKGANFCIPFCVIHKDKNIWENPEKFDPDRFLPEREKNRPRYSYIPFGTGSRGCIGSRFATTQIQLMLSMILQRFSLSFTPNQEIVPTIQTITLQPKFGLKLLVQSLS
jgi:cytochrome P450